MNVVFLDTKTMGDNLDFSQLEELAEINYFETTTLKQRFERCAQADILITNKVNLDKELLSQCQNLKLICIAATGMNNVDLDYCKENDILVQNAKGYSTNSVVQHTFSMALYLLGSSKYFDDYTRESQWQDSDIFTHHGRSFSELAGKSWGVIGLGEIGKGVAKVASAFGSRVQYFSTSGKNIQADYNPVGLSELLESSDIISIHCPLNEQTKNLITKKELLKLKDHAVLLNLGRGGIINEQDLAQILPETKLRVGLDVVESEPIDRASVLNNLLGRENFYLTPHIAWASQEARQQLLGMICEHIHNFQKSTS